MANTNADLKSVEDQSAALARTNLKQFTQQAATDPENYLQRSRADLERWTGELQRGEIDVDDLRGFVRGRADLAEMRALKQAGLAQASIDTFTRGVLDIVVSAIFAAIP